MAGRLSGILVADRTGMIVMLLVGMMDHHSISGFGLARVVPMTVRHRRAHAPV